LRNPVTAIRTSALGRRAEASRSAWQSVLWWETRRIPFNVVVGLTGVFTAVAMACVLLGVAAAFGVPWDFPDPPLLVVVGVLLYGVAANVCYTAGWMSELVVRRVWPERSDAFAERAFAIGVLASICVTLSPIIVWVALLIGSAAGKQPAIHSTQ
jgi:hypothetical protein